MSKFDNLSGKRLYIIFYSINIIANLDLFWGFVHLPLSRSQIADLQYLTNRSEISHHIDAQTVGCYTHKFSLDYTTQFKDFLRFSLNLDFHPQMKEILREYPQALSEYFKFINYTNNIAREKWNPQDKFLQPYTVQYNFTTAAIDIEIYSYRDAGWYCRKFVVHCIFIPCLLNIGHHQYQEEKYKIDSLVRCDLMFLILFASFILFIKLYNLVLYWKYNI